MSERDGYEYGVPCWVATVQPDPERAVSFYRQLFGWDTESLMPADAPGEYFLCKLRGRDVAAVVSHDPAPPPAPPAQWGTYIWVDSADEATAKVTEHGGSVVIEPFDSPAGSRMAVLADPSEAVFCVWEPGEHTGAQLVNEPSAWAMSQLNTRDPEGAKAFYGGVFGWETDAFRFGETEFTMWRVPGYVGGEPEQPVSREVVGTMAPMSEDQFPAHVPPHWSVDFWIADADAAAGRAAALGGTVVAPPHDLPGFRRAVLADPDGAAFSVSQLVLPGS